MKKWLFILLGFTTLVVTSCASPSPTPVPTMVVEHALNTVAPPTVTETAVLPTATLTPQPTNTPIPPTATPLPTITPTPAPAPPGEILFMFYPYIDMATFSPSSTLYKAVPSANANEWQLIPIMEDVFPGFMDVSPDGSKLAFSMTHDTDGDGITTSGGYGVDYRDIFIYDLQQDHIQQLSDTRNYSNPIWTQDGQSIITMSPENKVVDIFLDGTPQETLLSLSHTRTGSLSISPDDKLLLYTMYYDASRGKDLLAYDRDTQESTILRENDPSNVNFATYTWNATGEWWAYGDGANDKFILNRDTLDLSLLWETDSIQLIGWSPRGDELAFYTQYTNSRNTVHIWNPTTQSTTELLTADNFHYSLWSPDEDILAVNLIENGKQQIVWLDANTGSTRVLLEAEPDQTLRLHAWSPDSQWLLLKIVEGEIKVGELGGAEGDSSGLYVLHIDSGQIYQIMDLSNGKSNHFLWTPISPNRNGN